ncbi:heparinase II/III domain-containing protein [Cerasicoccus frondis]|uniref:heparinase II/III domain-containing protein n=1 Tax=Cerasicoccus frondis TaxID=490090 RepID=UPI0028526135|nr:heparinase II/III family protein [Cerasicoccus frondis]
MLFIRVTLVLLAIFSTAHSRALAEDMSNLLAKAAKTHPRLFLPDSEENAFRAKLKEDALLRKASEHVIELADQMVELPTLKRELEGRRLLETSRACLRRMGYLGLAYRLTGDPKYALRAQAEMLAVAEFSDWNPSHFLDTGEMTAALAIGYDWCYDALSPEARVTIRQAIVEKGLQPSLAENWWWIDHANNWNQVCHAGMVMGALAIYEDEPELAEQMIQRALDNIHYGMGVYAPDGAYPEGPMYWSYGTSFNVLLIDALDSVLGSDFDLAQSPGFLDSSEYYLHASGPSGDFFNYSDCRIRNGFNTSMVWFADYTQNPALLWRERPLLEEFLNREHNPNGADYRLFPFALIWAPPMQGIEAPMANHWHGDGEVPVTFHRTSWEDPNATFYGIKGGSPSAGHAHMDAGTFVMESDGVRWAIDLGMQDYYSLESIDIQLWGKQRWDVFRLGIKSHNVLMVDGQNMDVQGDASIIKDVDDGPFPHTIIDTSPVYAGQLQSARRGMGRHEHGTVVVRDVVETLDHETEIRWGMGTHADVTIDSPTCATLRQDGKQLKLVVKSPANAQLEIYQMDPPPHDYDAPNPGAKMIGFTVKLPANSEEVILVELRPGGGASKFISPDAYSDW